MNSDLALSHLFCEKHPSDAASILVRLPTEYVAGFISSLPPELGVSLIHHMPTAYTSQLFTCLENGTSARLLAQADFSTAARLLRPLPADLRGQLMTQMDALEAEQLSKIFTYAPGSIGNLVEIPLLTGLGDWNVKHTLRELKKIRRHSLSSFPVVDDEHRFLGLVNVHTLLTARETRRLDELCTAKGLALPAHAVAASIVDHPAWLGNLSIPVIDSEGILLGLLHRKTLKAYISNDANLAAQDMLAPVLTLAELYWAASSSVIALLEQEPPRESVD